MKKSLFILTCCLWAAGLAWGFYKVYRYEFTPSPTNVSLKHWPLSSGINYDPKKFNLVMTIHPKCPCTRASVAELEELLTKTDNRLKLLVLFYKPKGYSEDWYETDTFASIKRIPHAEIIIDEDGQLSKIFEATTSGQTFLFDKKGNLLFSGGITLSRGHMGDNLGKETIISLVKGGKSLTSQTPTFGCPL